MEELMDIITENTLDIKAPAKINLTLDVTGRRPDGYHELKMIMQSINLYDRLTVSAIPHTSGSLPVTLKMDKPLPDNIPPEKNLVYKAAVLIREKYNINMDFNIFLKKNIPAAAGLAGGSSDCAATIIAINQLCRLGLPEDQLCRLGVTLGADVPFCIKKGTMLSEGIGEILTPLPPLPPLWLVLIKPGISVSTADVYKDLDGTDIKTHPDTPGMINAIKDKNIPRTASYLCNVLETVTIPAHPVINEIKKFLITNGAAGSLMSGSGPSVFGIFADKETAGLAYQKALDVYRDCDVILCTPYI